MAPVSPKGKEDSSYLIPMQTDWPKEIQKM